MRYMQFPNETLIYYYHYFMRCKNAKCLFDFNIPAMCCFYWSNISLYMKSVLINMRGSILAAKKIKQKCTHYYSITANVVRWFCWLAMPAPNLCCCVFSLSFSMNSMSWIMCINEQKNQTILIANSSNNNNMVCGKKIMNFFGAASVKTYI